MLIPQAAEKIAAHRAAGAVRAGRSITRANRAATLGIELGSGLKDLSRSQKARVAGTQFLKKNKKLVIGAGAVALAGTAFSNNTGPGSPKGNQNQARGMYGF